MSILFLFGAGANIGSKGMLPNPPPLGRDLFPALCYSFPQTWGALSDEITENFADGDFEKGMDVIWNSDSHLISKLLKDMGIYFLQFKLSNDRIDVYSELLDSLDEIDTDICFSTLNYDCLFESALSMSGLKINRTTTEPESDGEIVFLKIHGSCNFIPVKEPDRPSISVRGLATYSSNVVFNTNIKPVQLSEAYNFLTGDTALYPSMAIYARGKPVQISPNLIKNLQEKWKDRVMKSSKIVIIGVNPHIEDEHIWKPLSETDAQVFFIGNKKAFNKWKSRHRKNKNNQFIGSLFFECIDTLIDHLE